MVNSTTIKRSTEQKAPEASSTTNTAKGSFVNTLSQTLTAANAYLVSLLSQVGLKDLVPSHGDILVALFAQETVTMQDPPRPFNDNRPREEARAGRIRANPKERYR